MTPSDNGLCYPDVVTKRSLPEGFDNAESSSSAEDLEKRGSGIPGFGWGAGAALTAGMVFKGPDFNRGQLIIDKFAEKLQCKDCMSCTQYGDEDDEKSNCCGCVCMDFVWGYGDIPYCTTCNPDDGVWPGSPTDGGGVILVKARSPSSSSEGEGGRELEEELEYKEVLLERGDKGEYSILDDRAIRTTITGKDFMVCGQRFSTQGVYKYPSFPAAASRPWDVARWSAISAYWGNSSVVCSNWGVAKTQDADVVYLASTVPTRAKYQSTSSLPPSLRPSAPPFRHGVMVSLFVVVC